jgi:Lipopolysaccharide assembly protein A domain
LIDFIAQNNRSVPIHFFKLSGHVSEAVALLVAAVGGAVIVLMAGAARIIQLRVSTHRHNRRVRKAANAEPAPEPAATAVPEPNESAAAATEGEAQPVETQPDA